MSRDAIAHLAYGFAVDAWDGYQDPPGLKDDYSWESDWIAKYGSESHILLEAWGTIYAHPKWVVCIGPSMHRATWDKPHVIYRALTVERGWFNMLMQACEFFNIDRATVASKVGWNLLASYEDL